MTVTEVDTVSGTEDLDDPTPEEDATADAAEQRRFDWQKMLAYGVIPALALLMALAAGYFKWQVSKAEAEDLACTEAVQAAKDSTVALLSYTPEDVEQKLGAARDLLTGNFRDSYDQLTRDVVIPGARQKQISAVATVPAMSPVHVTESHAVVLVFVDQTTAIGKDAPTASTSAVRVTLDRVNGRWLISQFDPV